VFRESGEERRPNGRDYTSGGELSLGVFVTKGHGINQTG